MEILDDMEVSTFSVKVLKVNYSFNCVICMYISEMYNLNSHL